jgi:hypothetical protein
MGFPVACTATREAAAIARPVHAAPSYKFKQLQNVLTSITKILKARRRSAIKK